MKKNLLVFLILLKCNTFIFAQGQGSNKGSLLLLLRDNKNVSAITTELAYINGIKTDIRLQRVISPSLHIYLFEFNSIAIQPELLLKAAQQNPFVKIAQFDHPVSPRAIPNDPYFGYLWNIQNTGQNNGTAGADIDAQNAWNIATGGLTTDGDTIVVAVIDYGFDLTHEDLSYWKNYAEIPGNGVDDDLNGYIDDNVGWNSKDQNSTIPLAAHGTHVCGIAGAKGNNGIGITGVNWNLKIMPISYGSGSSFESNVIAAYAYVFDQRKLYNASKGAKGAFVVASNSSFGIDSAKAVDHPLWCAMYDSLGSVGILSAGATNNYNNVNVDIGGDIPTSCSSNWLVTVTNTTNSDEKDTGAAYGPASIDLGAPGSNILSTVPISGYTFQSGTSMATPHVAGAIALMLSAACPDFIKNYKADPAGMALIIKDSLLKAVDVIPALNGKTVSGGRLNLFKSVRAMKRYCGKEEPAVSDDLFDILSIYPVPALDQLTIDYTSDVAAEIVVTSVLGQTILKISCTTSDKGIIQHSQISLAGLSKGIYFITMYGSDKRTKSWKVVF